MITYLQNKERLSPIQPMPNEIKVIQFVIFIVTKHQVKAKISGGKEQQWRSETKK